MSAFTSVTSLLGSLDLLGDPIFTKLARAQSRFDTADVDMQACGFTRSYYHILSFLITYAAADEVQRVEIVKNYNRLVAKDYQILTSKLNVLLGAIDWKSLLPIRTREAPVEDPAKARRRQRLSALLEGGRDDELDDRPPVHFDLHIEVPDPTAFLTALKENAPDLHACLENAQVNIELGRAGQVRVFTTVSESRLWSEPFRFQSLSGADAIFSFSSYRFECSPALKKLIAGLKEKEEKTFGCLRVKAGWGKKRTDLKLQLLVSREARNRGGRPFLFETTVGRTRTNPGIYRAFLGVSNYCRFPEPLIDVELCLALAANFSDIGAGVVQAQSFGMEAGAGFAVGEPTVITIRDLRAVLFPGAGIMVDYNLGPKAYPAKTVTPDCFLTLGTREAGPDVQIHAETLTPEEALSATRVASGYDEKVGRGCCATLFRSSAREPKPSRKSCCCAVM